MLEGKIGSVTFAGGVSFSVSFRRTSDVLIPIQTVDFAGECLMALSIRFTSACCIARPSSSSAPLSECRANSRDGEINPDISFRGEGFHSGSRLANQGRQIRRFELILLAPLIDARKIQNIFNKRSEPAAFPHQEREILAALFFAMNPSGFKSFRHEPHGGYRRPQFVGYTRYEIGFHFVQPLLLAEGSPGKQQSKQGGQSGAGNCSAKKKGAAARLCVEKLRVDETNLRNESRTARKTFEWVEFFRLIC